MKKFLSALFLTSTFLIASPTYSQEIHIEDDGSWSLYSVSMGNNQYCVLKTFWEETGDVLSYRFDTTNGQQLVIISSYEMTPGNYNFTVSFDGVEFGRYNGVVYAQENNKAFIDIGADVNFAVSFEQSMEIGVHSIVKNMGANLMGTDTLTSKLFECVVENDF